MSILINVDNMVVQYPTPWGGVFADKQKPYESYNTNQLQILYTNNILTNEHDHDKYTARIYYILKIRNGTKYEYCLTQNFGRTILDRLEIQQQVFDIIFNKSKDKKYYNHKITSVQKLIHFCDSYDVKDVNIRYGFMQSGHSYIYTSFDELYKSYEHLPNSLVVLDYTYHIISTTRDIKLALLNSKHKSNAIRKLCMEIIKNNP